MAISKNKTIIKSGVQIKSKPIRQLKKGILQSENNQTKNNSCKFINGNSHKKRMLLMKRNSC